MKQVSLSQLLERGLETVVRNANPWWLGESIAGVPSFRRSAFEPVYHRLSRGLAPAVLLRGPRQVGKTTLLTQVLDQFIRDGVDPKRLFRLQFDDLSNLKRLATPLVELVDWYVRNVLGDTLNSAAAAGRAPFLFLDEVQNLPEWAPQLKHLVDLGKVRAMVTGSSALRIDSGHDSLAGRVQTLEMGPLLLENPRRRPAGFGGVCNAFLNGLAPLKDKMFWQALRAHGEAYHDVRDRAFQAFAERGAYPVAQVRADIPWGELADFLNESVVRRAIIHDLRMGSRGQKRDEHLLESGIPSRVPLYRAVAVAGDVPRRDQASDECRHGLATNPGVSQVPRRCALDSTDRAARAASQATAWRFQTLPV